jgi:hypothetical protein
MNTLKQSQENITYKSVLLPAPALRSKNYQFRAFVGGSGKHTFSMDPQERPARFPFSQCLALEKPFCCSTMSRFRNKVLVRRRVRRGEPLLRLLLQLVACKYRQPRRRNAELEGKNKRCALFILFNVW